MHPEIFKKTDSLQPVAVAVTRVPSSPDQPRPNSPPRSRYHGTTLSSFTSLTLHPHPLVAFSVRLPSRMADYLRPPPKPTQLPSALQQLAASLPEPPLPPFPLPRPAQDLLASVQRLTSPQPVTPGPRLTVSLLSKSNETIAHTMSTPQADQAAAFALPHTWDTADPPALLDSIGKLRCEVVTSIPLRDVCGGCEADDDGSAGTHPGSELFICRVLAVENGEAGGGKPMLYWRQKYIGVEEEGS